MGTVFNKLGGAVKLITKAITANGTYNAEDDNAKGYSSVTVNVNQSTETKSISSNGTYTPSSGKIGFSQVSVAVPAYWDTISGVSFSWRTSAGYLISKSLSGYSYVILKCRTSGAGSSYIKDVYIGMPTNGTVVYGGWHCHHNDGSSDMEGNCVVRIHANSNGVYLDSFDNSDTRTAAYQALSFVALYGIK